MPHPRITARVSPAPTGDYGVLSFDFRGRTFAKPLDTREEIDLANELAGIVNILAIMEAHERAERLILRPEDIAEANALDEEAGVRILLRRA